MLKVYQLNLMVQKQTSLKSLEKKEENYEEKFALSFSWPFSKEFQKNCQNVCFFRIVQQRLASVYGAVFFVASNWFGKLHRYYSLNGHDKCLSFILQSYGIVWQLVFQVICNRFHNGKRKIGENATNNIINKKLFCFHFLTKLKICRDQ